MYIIMYRLLGSGRHACRSDCIPLSLSVHYCKYLIKEGLSSETGCI